MFTTARLVAMLSFWPAVVLAAEIECDKDSDCGKNATCVKRSGPSENPGKSATCEPIPAEFIGTHQAPCDVDADCREGLICATFEYTCPTFRVTCFADVDCAEPPAPDCDTVTERRCHYPWQLVCETDADCGSGFSCEPCPCVETATQVCACTSASDGYCQAIPSGCTTDGACGPGLTCDESDGACVPAGFVVLGQAGVAEGGPRGTAGSAGSSSGGCTATPRARVTWMPWLPVFCLLLLFGRPRRDSLGG
ncbi:MAG: hypothetical protein IV100_13910 [Myxococcales bacterium]|nr:hypothetical protein [Myxococcales bacterium]